MLPGLLNILSFPIFKGFFPVHMEGESMDALTLSMLVAELKEKIVPSRFRKIYEMDDRDFLISLWSGTEHWLSVILTREQKALHLTRGKDSQSKTPSSFCMLLRKHLEGAPLIDITQPPLERLVTLHFASASERGKEGKKLVIELFGREGNLILLDESSRIVRSIVAPPAERIGPERLYIYPPQKPAAHFNTFSSFNDALSSKSGDSAALEEALMKRCGIMTRIQAREIIFTADLEPSDTVAELGEEEKIRIFHSWCSFRDRVDERRIKPLIFLDEETGKIPVAWALWRYHEYAHLPHESCKSLNALFDVYYRMESPEGSSFDGLKRGVLRSLREKIKRAEKRKISILRDLEKAKESTVYRQMGELILLNMSLIKKGDTSIEVLDIYTEGEPILTIELNPILNASENAQQYFQRFKKSKRAGPILAGRMEETESELEYLQSLLVAAEEASTAEELDELEKDSVLSPAPGKKTAPSSQALPSSSGPRRFIFEGWEILAGKNPRQNDELSLKIAHPEDLWFHAHGMPGAHVVLRTGGKKDAPSKDIITRAATVAAYYSKGKNSGKVPVSLTKAKYVKKTRHMHPGMVTIQKERSLMTNPADESFLSWLEKQGSARLGE